MVRQVYEEKGMVKEELIYVFLNGVYQIAMVFRYH